MATALGLGARALDLPVTFAESSQGLVPPAVAVHLMGQVPTHGYPHDLRAVIPAA